jgi:hypothetical protein
VISGVKVTREFKKSGAVEMLFDSPGEGRKEAVVLLLTKQLLVSQFKHIHFTGYY